MVGAVVDAVALGVHLVDALLVLALEAVVGADAGGCGETKEEEEDDVLKERLEGLRIISVKTSQADGLTRKGKWSAAAVHGLH